MALLTIYAAALLFTGLANSALQVDEGCDTFIAATILKFGYPRHSDGINSSMPFADVRNGVFVYRTWFPYYLQALSIGILGQNTFAARLPFALAGLLAVPSLYLLALRLTGNKWHAFTAAFFLASSVPALLLFRTARYVGLPVFLTTLLLYFYLDIYSRRQWNPALFLITAFLYFHTMYVEFFGVLSGLLIHLLSRRETLDRTNIKGIIISAAVILFFSLPWLIYMWPVLKQVEQYYRDASPLVDTSGWRFLKHFAAFLFQINTYIFPLLLLPLFFRAPCRPFYQQIRLLAVCCASVVGVGCLHSIPLPQYISASLPLLYILSAIAICQGISGQAAVKAGVVIILALTNIVHILPFLPVKSLLASQENALTAYPYVYQAYKTMRVRVRPRSLLLDHIDEISHSYQGSLDHIIAYFKTQNIRGQTIFIDHEEESLAFYTGGRVFGPSHLSTQHPPDWIVLRSGMDIEKAAANPGLTALQTLVTTHAYKKITLTAPVWRINNSYDLGLHHFQPPQTGGIYIYQLTARAS